MDEGRKRVSLIAASILVARHLKELNSGARTPAVESLISNASSVATRITQKIRPAISLIHPIPEQQIQDQPDHHQDTEDQQSDFHGPRNWYWLSVEGTVDAA